MTQISIGEVKDELRRRINSEALHNTHASRKRRQALSDFLGWLNKKTEWENPSDVFDPDQGTLGL